MPKFIDLIGKKFGKLIVIKYANKNQWGQIKWLCQCDCGKEIVVLGYHLKSGHTQSCGCFQKEMVVRQLTKHGHNTKNGTTATYLSWRGMIQRCTDPNFKQYKDYGGRGITVCQRWENFTNFLEDMGERPSRLTLDRIKNDKGYCKSNCRWATRKQQARNRQNNRLITYNGKAQCVAAWAEETGIHKGTILRRLKLGWSTEKALITPAGKQGKQNNE